MTFEQALREQCEATDARRRKAKRILAVLDAAPSKRRTRRLDRMQRHVEVELGMNIADWSDIDWPKLFDTILKLLLALLPFLI